MFGFKDNLKAVKAKEAKAMLAGAGRRAILVEAQAH